VHLDRQEVRETMVEKRRKDLLVLQTDSPIETAMKQMP
jgi:hypothetical protein